MPQNITDESLNLSTISVVTETSGDKVYTVGGVSFTMKPIAAVMDGIIGDNAWTLETGDCKTHEVKKKL